MASSVCPTCKKVPPPGVVVCPNDGTALSRQPTPKPSASRPRPAVITGPELHHDLNAMRTERISPEHLSPEHLRVIMQQRSLEEDAFQTQQMHMSHIASKLAFEMRPGLSVGEYIVEEKLGEGGMGEVWRARQPMIDKQVALKVLGQDIIANKSSLSRFLQEARAVNQIKHRNLVDIFSFGELPDGRPYFVMEYLEGKDLGAYLAQGGVLPFSEVLQLFEQVCRALQAAHEREVIHRDLKPDNIFLILEPNQPPFVKILDFGIAKLEGGDQKRLTHTNAVFGTPGYMAPEQCEGAKNVDHRADIYALAVILFEALTGQTPFALPGESAFAIVARQMTSEPPLASQRISNRTIPPAVDRFLRRALSRKREARPQSCAEFYQELIDAIGDKRSETRAQMGEWVISTSAPTDINIEPSGLSRLPSKSQLEGLVGEVVAPSAPKRDKKRLAIWVGAALSLLLGSGLVAFLLPAEAPTLAAATPPPPVLPAPVSAPVSQPSATSPTPPPVQPAPPKTTKNSKTKKKSPKTTPTPPKTAQEPPKPAEPTTPKRNDAGKLPF